jgi:Ca2+-binding EF-hand superfamily protein
MRPIRLALVILCGAMSAARAIAAAPDATPADKSLALSKIDTDGDGTISWDEAKAAATAKFTALDTDKEGTLDASELTGVVPPAAAKKADTDKDGTLDQAEYLSLVQTMFKAADTDHDGTLEPKELSTAKGRALVAVLAY